MKKMIILSLVLFSFSLFAQVEQAEKLIVTVSTDWDSNEGTMYLFNKTSKGWEKIDLPAGVHFGKAGLAWGVGVHTGGVYGNHKKEGDKRSPAGIFTIGTLYGIDPQSPAGVRYPYRQLTKKTRCIDDAASVLYNKIIEEDSTMRIWNSAERMYFAQPDYKYVLIVEHNSLSETGKGSCIFFHINNVPTTGCTSMDETTMLKVLQWLDPKKKTLIVQLPKGEYLRYQSQWKLPALPEELP